MSPETQQLCVLGSTGSIGVNTLAVAEHLGIAVQALSANSNVEVLAEQARRHKVKQVVIGDPDCYAALKQLLSGSDIAVAAGADAIDDMAADDSSNIVMSAIVGAAGLRPTLAACQAGKRVCIANKEPLVIAGRQIMAAAAAHKAEIIPVDSEHSAVFQCLEQHSIDEVDKIILTGSGGPLRQIHDLNNITREQALQHPNWSMGDKITIDSATLMNKGLELIEASHLFGIAAEQIEVVIHPQSIIHSMVAFHDGSVAAQLGLPDMRTPIQYALSWPRHCKGPVPAPDFVELGSLDFEAVDHQRFPGIELARRSLLLGDYGPCALNAANEHAVAAFLNGRMGFTDIFSTIASALEQIEHCSDAGIDDIIACDLHLREALLS